MFGKGLWGVAEERTKLYKVVFAVSKRLKNIFGSGLRNLYPIISVSAAISSDELA